MGISELLRILRAIIDANRHEITCRVVILLSHSDISNRKQEPEMPDRKRLRGLENLANEIQIVKAIQLIGIDLLRRIPKPPRPTLILLVVLAVAGRAHIVLASLRILARRSGSSFE